MSRRALSPIVALLLAAAALVPAGPPALAAKPAPVAVRAVATPGVVPVGGLVTLTFRIRGARDVHAVPFHLVYPADLLEYVDGAPGPFLAPARGEGSGARPFFMADGAPGRLFVALARFGAAGGGAGGSGTLCTLRFRARAAGAARLSFEDAHVVLADRSEAEASFEAASLVIR